ncbi:siphovirus Gp157 family protein [Hoeflea sp. CAU 1731]
MKSELTRFTALRRQIIESDPEIDETTLLDTLEGATDLNEAIAAVVRSALDDECLVTGIKARLSELKERLDRIQIRIEKKRQLALSTMEEAGIEKILEPDFTLSLRTAPPSVLVTDETIIPEWFWVPQPAKLDKRALLDTLKAGTAITGAELANTRRSLGVRKK